MPSGHPPFPPPAYAGSLGDESPTSWAPLLQFAAWAEQHARRIAREEFEILYAEKVATSAEIDKNDQLLTVQQAAEMLKVIPQTVYQWIKAEKVQSHIVGRNSIRLKRGDVIASAQLLTQSNGRRKYARRGKEMAHA